MQDAGRSGGRRRLTQLAAIVLVLSLAAAGTWWFFLHEPRAEPAPDFTLTDLDGQTFRLSDYRGEKVVVLDFWALWCTFCTILAKETLQPLQEAYDDELVVLAINVDATDKVEDQRRYQSDHNFTFRYAPDTDTVALKYSVVDLPRLVIIDQQGYATFAGLGVAALSHDRVTTAVEEALDGQAQTISINSLSLLPLAVLAGVFFFFSPCAFPLLPGYMSYYLTGQDRPGVASDRPSSGGFDRATLRRALPAGAAAASGLALTNLLIAGIILAAASLVKPYLALLSPTMGLVIIVLGIAMLADRQFYFLVRPFQWLGRVISQLTRRLRRLRTRLRGGALDTPVEQADPRLGGLFLYGVGYGGAASGCCAPIFIMLLLLAATTQGLATGLLVMTLYTLTGATLMIAVTLATAASERTLLEKLRASTRHIKVASGILLIGVGLYLVWSYYRAYGATLPF